MYSHSESSFQVSGNLSPDKDVPSNEHPNTNTSVHYHSEAHFIQFVNSAAEEIIRLQKSLRKAIDDFSEMIKVEEGKNDALRKELEEYTEDETPSLNTIRETLILGRTSSGEQSVILEMHTINMDLVSYTSFVADEIINLAKIMEDEIKKLIQKQKEAQDKDCFFNDELKKRVATKKIKEALQSGKDHEVVRQIVSSFALQLDVTEEKLMDAIDNIWARLPKIEEKLSEVQMTECDNITMHDTSDARSFVQLFAFFNEYECNGCHSFSDLNLYMHGNVKTLRSLSCQFPKELKFRHTSKVKSRLRGIDNIYRIMMVTSPEEAVSVFQAEMVAHPLIFRLHHNHSSYYLYTLTRCLNVEGSMKRAVLALVALRYFRLISPFHLDTELLMWFLRRATGVDKQPLDRRTGVRLAFEIIA